MHDLLLERKVTAMTPRPLGQSGLDVMPLCFLTNQRMDNKNLLLEGQHMRALKLRQVVEIVFDVYDNQLAAMGDQLERMEQRLAAQIAGFREN